MALTRIIVKPTAREEYIFHIVKYYAILKTSQALRSAVFRVEQDKQLCTAIEDNFVEGNIYHELVIDGSERIEGTLSAGSPLWRGITIDAIKMQLAELLQIVKQRQGSYNELESVAQKLPELFRAWSSARAAYFRQSSKGILITIGSESTEAGSTTGAPKATVKQAKSPGAQAATSWCECLCCCSQPKAEEPTAESPLVSPG